jgi:hypothetical protein
MSLVLPDRSPGAPGDGLLNPAALGAIALLLLNDHRWKLDHPGVVTGKLSDIAGLVFFPLLLQAAWELARAASRRPFHPSRRLLVGAVVATGLVFTLVKTLPFAGTCYRWGLAALQWPFRALLAADPPPLHPVALVQDATDLLALPALAVALAIGWPRATGRRPCGRMRTDWRQLRPGRLG